MENTKKLILSASFGTAVTNAIERDIVPLEQAYAAAFPEYEVRRAFTSAMSRRKLAEHGIVVPSVEEAVAQAKAEGFSSIHVAVNLISPGEEYNRLCSVCEGCSISRPLLDTEEDFSALAALFADTKPDSITLLMGHGAHGKTNEMYARLAEYLPENVYIACMDGGANLGELMPTLLQQPRRKVTLIPFLLVAAAHVTKDMLGDGEDSWKSIMTKAGFSVEGVTSGLGSSKVVQELYVSKVKEIL